MGNVAAVSPVTVQWGKRWWQLREGLAIRTVRLAGVGAIVVVATFAGGYFLLPLAVRGFVRLLTLTVNAAVWFAAALGSGEDAWTIVSAVGRATAATLATPQVSAIIGVLVLVGALALVGLQRLLGSEEESSR